MINDLKNEAIVIEIQDLVKGIENIKEEMDIYCELMKQLILTTSNKN